jgi:circadian clock protein KaiA
MLLLVFILPTNVKKILDKLSHAASLQSLSEKMWNLIDAIIVQFYAPVTVTTNVKISDLPRCVQPESYQQFTEKLDYVFACNKQKNQLFFQQMTQTEQQEFLEQVKSDYRQIIINYFITDKSLKAKIDKFINAVFYANIPVPQIIEIHMEVIDEFAKQLRLEGRSDETLLDYRLTLIDILAHLCEVYRCAIAKTN